MHWKDQILSQFVKNAGTNVWAVSDPDGIVRNERILSQLQQSGFECFFYEDPMEFRCEYESRIRRAWTRGDELPVIILFDDRTAGFNVLPSDVLESAAQLSFALSSLFPSFDADVLRGIPVPLWDRVHRYLQKSPGKSFNRRESEELALRLCYKISADLIDSPAELLRRLLDLHRKGEGLSSILALRLASEMKMKRGFSDLPILQLASDQRFFWKFCESEWKSFLEGKLSGEPPMQESAIPFESPMLRGYIETLLDEGLLPKLAAPEQKLSHDAWWKVGFQLRSTKTEEVTIKELEALTANIPSLEAHSRDWIEFSLHYGRLVSLLFRCSNPSIQTAFWVNLWPTVDSAYHQWLGLQYGGLHNLPASPPVMQNHIPKQLNRHVKKGRRVALILLDGMSLAGWFTVQDELQKQLGTGWKSQTSGVISWLPSLTPICRQAVFSGQAPRLLEKTIGRTDCDGSGWKAFWEANAEFLPKQIYHALHQGNPQEAELDEELLATTKVIGITVTKPDKIMHGATLGWRGWHQQIQLWMQNGYLAVLINRLSEAGFVVCITADHGNLEAVGSGKINEGSLAESRGQRARVYSNETLRNAAMEAHSEVSQSMDIQLLPDSHYPIFAKGRGAFITKDEIVVTHGGASLDEMIVPWVVINGEEE